MTDLNRLRGALDWIDRVEYAATDDEAVIIALEAAEDYWELLTNSGTPNYGESSNILRRHVRETTIGFGRLTERVVDAAIDGRLLVDPPKEEE